MRLPFVKFTGCGNDFILFDNRLDLFPSTQLGLFSKLCHRQCGIGADGVILLENSQKADYRMRIFNADNSEAEMCGNGLRCLVNWIEMIEPKKPTYLIETMQGQMTVSVNQALVCVEMGSPQNVQWNLSVDFLGQKLQGHYLNTGVPHLIIFVENVDEIDVASWGAALRHHARWSPQGTNVNFVQIISERKIKLRTFERGVEGETLACGTGATASALAAAYQHQILNPITVETRSKENLTIDFSLNNNHFSLVKMSGPARYIYCGEVDLF